MEWEIDFPPKVKELGSVHELARSERGIDFEWRLKKFKLEDISEGEVESPQFSAFGLRWYLTLGKRNDTYSNPLRIGIWRGAGPDPVRLWLAVLKADFNQVVVGRGTLRPGWNENYFKWMFFDELEIIFPSFLLSGTLTILARLRTGPETADEMRGLYRLRESESSLEAGPSHIAGPPHMKVSDVYTSCSYYSELTDEDSNVSLNSVAQKTIEDPTSKNITAGTYLLIYVFGGKKNLSLYKYVGIAQSDMDEDGEIKVMFLRSIDDSGRNFHVKENGVSYVQFDEVLGILKNPSLKMKGNKIYYEFDQPVDVYEK